ncbi:MAG: LysE family transporter [bacterium]|nr:LysE family transporter [bacterium]
MILFLLQVFIISLSGVLAPGPVTAATIAAGTKSKHAGIFICIGHSAVELPLLAAIMLGMGFILEYPMAKMLIGLAGGVFLLWMGFDMFRDLKNFRENQSAVKTKGPVMTGLILSITNPYFLLWWATVGLNLAKNAAGFGYLAVVLFALTHTFCDMFWLEILSFTSFKGSKLLNEKSQRMVLGICAVAIMFFGFYFIVKSFLTL